MAKSTPLTPIEQYEAYMKDALERIEIRADNDDVEMGFQMGYALATRAGLTFLLDFLYEKHKLGLIIKDMQKGKV